MQTKLAWAYSDNFNDLPVIEDVQPISEQDLECLHEVREVLKKHSRLQRFGVALLHKHFDLQEGEVLVETTDEVAREQIIEPKFLADIEGQSLIPTILSLANEETLLGCYIVCAVNANGHRRAHGKTAN